MAKRILTAVIAAIILCAGLNSCSRRSAVLSISGAQINREVFAYFLDSAAARPEHYGLSADAGARELTDCAASLCTHYIAANTMFSQYGLSLTNAQKINISEAVNNLWVRYENHYNEIGVSRSTLTKIQTARTYEEAIFTFLFDRGREDEEAEKDIRAYFDDNFVIFRAVTGYYIATDATGNDIAMTEVQKNELIAAFGELAKTVNSGKDIETAAKEAGYVASSTVLLKRNQSGYPQGFFEDVQGLENETASVLSYADSVFVVGKLDITKRDEEYSSYRTECIKDMYSEAAEKVFELEESGYETVRNEKEINRFCKSIEIYG